MRKSYSKLVFLFFLVLVNAGFSQDKYQPGYYVDYSDSIHHGLIHRFLSNGQNKIRFKETEKADRIKLGMDQLKQFVMNQDTFEIRNVKSWERKKPLSFSKNDSVGDFVKVLERGKIELFAHHHFEYRTSNTWSANSLNNSTLDTKAKVVDFIARKDSMYATVKNANAGARLPSGYYGVRKLIADDTLMLARFDKKDYKREDLRSLVATYNARAANRSIRGQVVLFRRSAKSQPKEVNVQYQNSIVGKLTSTSLVELEVENIHDFSICIEGLGCTQLSGSSGMTNYLELIQEKKAKDPTIVFVNKEVGKYYHQRISYLMEKAKKKK